VSKNKVAILEGRIFSSQSELIESAYSIIALIGCMDKSWPSKNATNYKLRKSTCE